MDLRFGSAQNSGFEIQGHVQGRMASRLWPPTAGRRRAPGTRASATRGLQWFDILLMVEILHELIYIYILIYHKDRNSGSLVHL